MGLGHNLDNLAARTLAGIFLVVNEDFAVGQGRAVFPQAVDYVEIGIKSYVVTEEHVVEFLELRVGKEHAVESDDVVLM